MRKNKTLQTMYAAHDGRLQELTLVVEQRPEPQWDDDEAFGS